MKWTGAVVLAAAISSVVAGGNDRPAFTPRQVADAALKATRGVPSLRAKDGERTRALKSKLRALAAPKDRKLQQDGGYYNYYGNANYNNNQNQAQDGQDGANGYYQDGYWYGNQYNQDYQWDQEMAEEQFGFDITAYSLKYTGCHTVETYNENMAADDRFETVLGKQRYATFRLCPADTCSANNKWGCDDNFGEYVVPLEEYVEGMVAVEQERVLNFCEYCQDCAAREAYRQYAMDQQSEMEYMMQYADQLFQQYIEQMKQQAAYEEANANANGGGYYMYNNNQYNNNQNNNNGQDGQEDEDETSYWMVKYYQNIANQNNQNQNNNNNNNQNNGGYANQQQNQYQQPQNYNYYNQNMWNFKNNNNNNQQNQYNGYDQNQAWSNMNSNSYNANGEVNNNVVQFARFMGHKVYPGYFSNQGEFVEDWGYFLSNGQWVSLQEFQVSWDETLNGELPPAWENYIDEYGIGVAIEELEPCEYQYSRNCYQSYDLCMRIFTYNQEEQQDQYYQQYLDSQAEVYNYNQEQNGQRQNGNGQNGNGQNGNQNGQNQYMEGYRQYWLQQQRKKVFEYQALTGEVYSCQQIDYMPEYEGNYGNDYEQTQYQNVQFYQLNKYLQAQLEACEGNAACENTITAQMEENQNFMTWLEEYNQNEYDQWINGMKQYFIGANCNDDNTITLAVYNDEACSYTDQSLSVEDVLGFDPISSLEYNLIPDECIPCNAMDVADTYITQQQDVEEQYQEEGYVEGVTPMCSMMYQISGKCNENLKPQNLFNGYYNGDGEYVEPAFNQMYQSYSQQQNQEKVCSFVESLNSGTYNQDGQIYLDNSIWSGPARWQQGIAEASRNMPGGLKASLFLTALAAALMGVWACMLHGALARKNIPWQPKRNIAGDPVDMARQNSGIVMGRSRSGPATHPLI